MRVRRCTTGTRRTPQFSTTVELHGFADVTPNGLYVRHHLPQYFLNGMGHPQKSHKTDKRPTPHVPGDPGEIDPAQLLRPSIRRPATGFVGSCWLPGAAPHFSRTADGQTALGSPPASPPPHVEEIAVSQRRPPAEEPCLQEEQALIWRVVFQHAHEARNARRCCQRRPSSVRSSWWLASRLQSDAGASAWRRGASAGLLGPQRRGLRPPR